MIHKFFPMANAFFTSLGFNVVLTDPTSEETIRLSQQLAQSETCYPVKLIYGHIQQLIDQKVDYIFLPSIHTMKHEKSRVKHNYGGGVHRKGTGHRKQGHHPAQPGI